MIGDLAIGKSAVATILCSCVKVRKGRIHLLGRMLGPQVVPIFMTAGLLSLSSLLLLYYHFNCYCYCYCYCHKLFLSRGKVRPGDKLQDYVSAFMVVSRRARLGALVLVRLFVRYMRISGVIAGYAGNAGT